MKAILNIVFVLLMVFIFTPNAFAHVVVKPNEVGLAAFQTFTVGVPVEKEIGTNSLRLVLPEGLDYVTPNQKAGWEIEVKKEGEGEDAKTTEIIWYGNTIPAGFRDEFSFSAKVPSEEIILKWKAYQTYEDGTVVAWEEDPKAEHSDDEEKEEGSEEVGPYSETKVIDDLAIKKEESENESSGENKVNLALGLSVVAVVLSAFTLGYRIKKKK